MLPHNKERYPAVVKLCDLPAAEVSRCFLEKVNDLGALFVTEVQPGEECVVAGGPAETEGGRLEMSDAIKRVCGYNFANLDDFIKCIAPQFWEVPRARVPPCPARVPASEPAAVCRVCDIEYGDTGLILT